MIVYIKIILSMEVILSELNNLKITTDPVLYDLVNEYLNSKDVQENSKELYRRTLKQYFSWIDEKKYHLSEITRAQVLEYKKDLISHGKSSLTIGSYINSVRCLYEWTEANKYYPNVAKGVKTPRRKHEFRKMPLKPDQVSTLLSYFEGKNLRDYAIASLMLRTGLRTIEVVRANVGDFTYLDGQRILKVHGKGTVDKDDFVIITDKTYPPILSYLKERGDVSPSSPLFVSTSNQNRGEGITTKTISAIMKAGLRAIGLDSSMYTAHSLRHTGATNILMETGDLEQVRQFCRHTNPATTLTYTATVKNFNRLKNSGESVLDRLY